MVLIGKPLKTLKGYVRQKSIFCHKAAIDLLEEKMFLSEDI